MWRPAGFLALSELALFAFAQFNNPTGVDIWCGKAYRATDSSFDPGGWFEDPPVSIVPLLRLKGKSRMSIYLDTDSTASLLVDAEVSNQLGEPISDAFLTTPAQSLKVDIVSDTTVLGSATLQVGSTENEVPINLSGLTPSLDSYNLTIKATLGNSTVYTAYTSFSYLPYPSNYGSVSRLDNLYGGLYAQRGSNSSWTQIFPYTYYVQWSLYWDANVTTLDDFSARGYNMIHIVPTGTLGDSPFPWAQFQPYLDRAAELGIWLQYDVIWQYANLTGMIEQVSALRTHPSILSWYQSDEADGKSNPLNSTGIAYDAIRSLDPYHPISLALNCHDFYYEDYAAGADIIVPDVYPVSTNTSYSAVYDTVCNATYGCCGCDDCGGGFDDISDRLDEFRRRDSLIGWSKTQWFAPQAFGNETFWARYPTAEELELMTMVAINHGAKGITMWDYPTTAELFGITGEMAGVLTGGAVAGYLVGAPRSQDLDVAGSGVDKVDAAAWVDEPGGTALVGVVNMGYADVAGPIEVALPDGLAATAVTSSVWGDSAWDIGSDGSLSLAAGLSGLATSVILVEIS